MPWIEVIAVGFGLLCVALTIRQNIWCWPAGLVQVTLFIVVFYQARLYSDLILHVIYVGLQFYGWYQWLHGGAGHGALAVSRLPLRARLLWPLAILTGTLAWGYGMSNYTDAAAPYANAFMAAASLVAQYLLSRKRLEAWLVWIVVDLVAIGVYWQQELRLTAGLYTVFLVLAGLGWLEWRRAWRKGAAQS